MLPHLLRIGVLLSLSGHTLQTALVDSPSYMAAVVEYHPVTDGDDGQMIADANANNYRTIIRNASYYNVDIIVFPEYGLTSLPKDGDREREFNETGLRAYYRDTASYVPSPNETVILCDTDNKYARSLQSMSCAAREYKMYVVVNHYEKVDCPKPNCARDGFLLYNTNIVFDRKGRVVARYRKFNLFKEPGVNVTAAPEISTFTTDFGVTFGQFICFDILYEKPAMHFAKNPNVTDVVYTTHWLDEMPFLGAVQKQAAWAYSADVNLLASDYSDAVVSGGGSGIYAGKSGPIRIYNPHQTSNALVVAEVPKLNRRKRVEDVNAGKSTVHVFKQAEVPTVAVPPSNSSFVVAEPFYREDLRPYTSVLMDPSQGSHITTLCNNGLCCDFHVETSYDKELAAKPGAKQYRYRLVVFNGVRGDRSQSTAGLEVCALVSCAGDAIGDCGGIYSPGSDVVAPTSFDSLIITRRADLNQRVFYEPTTLSNSGGGQPLGNDFVYVVSGPRNSSLVLMSLVRPRRDVATFGIYGRRFDRDGQPVTPAPSSAASILPSIALAIMLTFVVFRMS